MAAAAQLLSQRADNPLGAAVAGGRHTLERWRDLGNAHERLLFWQGSCERVVGATAPLVGSAPTEYGRALVMAGLAGGPQSRCARRRRRSLLRAMRASGAETG